MPSEKVREFLSNFEPDLQDRLLKDHGEEALERHVEQGDVEFSIEMITRLHNMEQRALKKLGKQRNNDDE